MKPVAWMVGVSVMSAVVGVAVFGTPRGAEIVAGMLGPLAATTWSWTLAAHAFTRSPERLTAVMMKAFAVKLVFFGAYVAVAVRGLRLDVAPFMSAFTAYFVGLYLAEALCLRRLFAEAMSAPVERR